MNSSQDESAYEFLRHFEAEFSCPDTQVMRQWLHIARRHTKQTELVPGLVSIATELHGLGWSLVHFPEFTSELSHAEKIGSLRAIYEDLSPRELNWYQLRDLGFDPSELRLSPPDANVFLGQCVGEYQVIRLIGTGGTCHVFEVCNQATRLTYAAKVPRRCDDSRVDAEVKRLLAVEAGVLSQFSDDEALPNLIDYLEDQDRVVLVLELIRGVHLGDFAKNVRRTLDVERSNWKLLHVIARLARIIDRLHQRGLLLGDIKPANVMVQDDGTIRIIDFNVSRIQYLHSGWKNVAGGTADYMHPSALRRLSSSKLSDLGDADDEFIEWLDIKEDLFSLGILGLELLTGSGTADAHRSATGSPQSISLDGLRAIAVARGLPDSIANVISAACARRWDPGFETAADFADACVAVSRQGSTTAVMPRRRPLVNAWRLGSRYGFTLISNALVSQSSITVVDDRFYVEVAATRSLIGAISLMFTEAKLLSLPIVPEIRLLPALLRRVKALSPDSLDWAVKLNGLEFEWQLCNCSDLRLVSNRRAVDVFDRSSKLQQIAAIRDETLEWVHSLFCNWHAALGNSDPHCVLPLEFAMTTQLTPFHPHYRASWQSLAFQCGLSKQVVEEFVSATHSTTASPGPWDSVRMINRVIMSRLLWSQDGGV